MGAGDDIYLWNRQMLCHSLCQVCLMDVANILCVEYYLEFYPGIGWVLCKFWQAWSWLTAYMRPYLLTHSPTVCKLDILSAQHARQLPVSACTSAPLTFLDWCRVLIILFHARAHPPLMYFLLPAAIQFARKAKIAALERAPRTQQSNLKQRSSVVFLSLVLPSFLFTRVNRCSPFTYWLDISLILPNNSLHL